MATILLHHLYKLCCEKRFRANPVFEAPVIPRKILYKYLLIPSDEELPPAVTEQLNQTTNASSTVQQQRESVPRSQFEPLPAVQGHEEL